MLSFIQYISEEAADKGSLTIFDIDGTLVHAPDSKIHVVQNGQRIRSLTPQEYSGERLEPGQQYDYSDFRSSDKFAESHPIHRMIAKAQAITNGIARKPNSRVIIVTARQTPDDHQKFLDVLNGHGIDTNKVKVEFAGDQPGENDAEKKRVVIDKYLKSGNFNKTRLFDDKHENLSMFKSMQQDHPTVKFEAYHAQPNGRIRTFK